MSQTAFHTYILASELVGYVGNEALLPAFASSAIDVYPYQIAAARFALRSPYLKGCILCDEGSLGKTYEALLVAAQKWYEGRDRLLLVLPPNLIKQWVDKLENAFTLPYIVWNSGDALPEADGLVIVTYDFATRHAEAIAGQSWDLIIFDEADVLSKWQNKTVVALKAATGEAFKLLLTPTPITMSIMDIYGLIHFIDESVLPDADEFYKRYFRKPECYPELTSWVSRFAFRTLKSQVAGYVNFTERLSATLVYDLGAQEQALYDKAAAYLALPEKAAYPLMNSYDLTLMFYHTLSSSPQAFGKMLQGAIARLEEGAEKSQLEDLLACARKCGTSTKSQRLLSALRACFAKLKQLKLPQKAVVFINNLTTLGILKDLLAQNSYNIITTTEADYIERFRAEKTAILLATDAAAKGLDMEFCPVVINYDLLYNAIELEQRISRCHRQGQQSDVLVINLLCKENIADVRILELINKRTLQFDGIFGLSDDIVGSFHTYIDEMLPQIRPPEAVKATFAENLSLHRRENRQVVSHAEDTLFTTFSKAVADKVTVSPRAIEEKVAALQEDLWQVVKAYFANRQDYTIDEQAKTITLIGDTRPQLFYYHTGSNNKLYTGLKRYGLDKNFKPASGRITLTSPLVRGILSNTACADSGEITVAVDSEPCEIGFYRVSIRAKRAEVAACNVLAGMTASGKVLSDKQCRDILKLPVLAGTTEGKSVEYWLRNSTRNGVWHKLDSVVPLDELLEAHRAKSNPAILEEAERLNLRAARKSAAMERALDDMRARIKTARQELEAETSDRLKAMIIVKQLNVMEKNLRGKEQSLFLDKMRVKVAAEDEVAALIANETYTAQVQRQFAISVLGSSRDEQNSGYNKYQEIQRPEL